MGDGPPGLFARFVSYGFVSELLRIVLETGALGQADLLALPAEHSVPRLVALYDDARRGGGGVYRGFFAVVRWQLFVGAAFQLVYVLSQLSQPVFVWLIVRSIEDDTMLGLYAALGLLAAMLVGNWCNQSHLHVMDVAALRLRGVAVAVMYRAAVEARTFEAAGTSAELVSIIATDTERFRDMAPFFQLLWASPAQIVLGAGLTVVIFGWQALIAVGILLGLYPVAMLLAQALRHARRLMQPFTEERVRLISELLHGTRVVKMYGWERPMLAAIRRVRALEMGQFVKELLVWAVVSCCLVSVPQVAQAATFAAFVHTEGPLRSADTFALLTLLGVIKFPVVYFGNAIMFLSQTVVGMERIRQFLDASGADRTTKPAPAVPVSPDSSSDLLKVHAARCLWKRPPAEPFDLGDAPAKAFELGPVDLTLRRRDVCVVLGPVGAGKSMLCDAVLGETWAAGGSVAVGAQSVAFAAQEPFLFTGTVRDNVLFHTPLDPARYAACLDACQLRADLAVLGEGDLTVVGERGVTLSGGQKARVALARACYAKADLVVLDDPLSALDARTGRLVLEALLGPGGLLRESGVLLVTHGHHHQWCANKRLALVDGAGAATALSRTADAALSSDSDDDGPADAEEDAPAVEELQEGNISLATLRRYVQQGGGWHWPVTVFLGVLLERVLYVASELWLSVWTSAADGPPTNGLIPGLRSAATEDGGRWYLYIYVGLSVATLLGATVRLLAFGRGCYRAAGSLFGGALEAVARCPAVWYDVTPTGRVLNRLSHDVDRVQYPLVAQLSSFVATLGWLSSGVVTTGAAAPYSLIATVPAIAAVAFLVWRFRVLNVHLQRLDIVARSVVQSFVFESLHGATTIRAFRRVDEAEAQCRASLADNLAAMYSFALAQRWLGVRCDSLGALITGSVALVCWLLRSSVDPSVAGFAFVWATNIARSLVFVVTDGVQSEAKLVSVERLVEYLDSLPKEAPAATETVPALPWPAKGRLEFKGATMRYRPELPLVLDGCTFAAEPGQRVGVVGRTGSGKSSLIVALFRLRELEGGQVLVDGQDIADLGLAHLRGQSMCIIPQDPVVFSGTVRSNVDPFEEFGDDAVQAAIEAVRLGPKVEAMGGIEAPTAAKGANLSVGQRQLLCIARAVLRRPRVLLMDEATANVDSRTDALIRDAVRRLFRGCTVVEVAHRLHSVMDADRIVVMGAGKVLEAGAPRALLARKGELHRMVHAAGDAAALAAMVQ